MLFIEKEKGFLFYVVTEGQENQVLKIFLWNLIESIEEIKMTKKFL